MKLSFPLPAELPESCMSVRGHTIADSAIRNEGLGKRNPQQDALYKNHENEFLYYKENLALNYSRPVFVTITRIF